MTVQLILASQSPRRHALLSALGLTFVVDTADVDETPHIGEKPDAMVIRLSRVKALAVLERHPDAAILAADTVVVLDGVVLGKPRDHVEATAMLVRLRDRMHQVYTAVSIVNNGRLATRLSTSDVTMRAYSDADVAAYVASGDPLDKAGAYAIQNAVFVPVAAWAGCYTGIMGLPLGVTVHLLEAAGVILSGDVKMRCTETVGCCCLSNGTEAGD